MKLSVLKTAIVGLSLTPALALANAINSEDPFFGFYQFINGIAGGALGTGLAVTMLVIGGVFGVARNSPMPALAGVAGAVFFHWGPQVIERIMTNGVVA